MEAAASNAASAPQWGALQRSVSVAVYGAAGLVGRELVRTLLEAAHPPTLMRLYDDEPRSLSYRDRPLLVRRTPPQPPATTLAFVTTPGAQGRQLLAQLVECGVRVVDVSGQPHPDPEVVLVAPGLGEGDVGAFTQAVCVPRGPLAWLAPLLARVDGLAGLQEVVATWIAPAAAGGLESLFRLRDERQGKSEQGASARESGAQGPGQPRLCCLRAGDGVAAGASMLDVAAGPASFDARVLRRLLAKPSLAVELTTLQGDVERVDAIQLYLRTERDLAQAEALRSLSQLQGVRLLDSSTEPSTAAVAGRMRVEVGCVRAGVRGSGSLSFFAVGDHLLAGAVRASLVAASMLPLG